MFASDDLTPIPEHLDWRVIPLPKEAPVTIIAAGPPVVVKAHFPKRSSKPCLDWITKGKLTCPWCGEVSRRQIAYLPFWPALSTDRRVFIVSRTMMLTLGTVRLGDVFVALQSKIPGKPGSVRRIPGEGSIRQRADRLRETNAPHDIRAYLVHLWQLPALDEFFGTDLPT